MSVAQMPSAPSLRRQEPGQSVLLENIDWDVYESLVAAFAETHVRMNYDDGRLEIMAPSMRHDVAKTACARVIETYSVEADIPIIGFGSATFRRKDLLKGIEPDECYYVANASRVAGRLDFDFTVDPPPDLALEVDITSHSINRQSIYAALGVPEIWRFDGLKFHYRRRNRKGQYVPAARSIAFPDLPQSELNRFVRMALDEHQHTAMRAVREWVRAKKS